MADLIWGIILSTIALLIFIMNTYIIGVLFKFKELHTRCNAFILCLACSDFLVSLFNIPFTVACTFDPLLRISGSTLCNITGFFEMTFLIASVYSVTAINFHRFIRIVYWQRYYEVFTIRRTYKLIIFIWMSAMVLSAPPLFNLSKISYKPGKSHCFVDWKATPVYTFALMGTCFFMPVCIMGYCYYRIFQHRKGCKKQLTRLQERTKLKWLPYKKASSSSQTKLEENRIEDSTQAVNDSFSRLGCKDEETEMKCINRGFVGDEIECHSSKCRKYKLKSSERALNEEKMAREAFTEHLPQECIKEAALFKRRNQELKGTRGIETATPQGNSDAFAICRKHTSGVESKVESADYNEVETIFDDAVNCGEKTKQVGALPSNSNVAKLRSRNGTGKELSKKVARELKEERKLTMMCIIIVAVFFISWFPFVITMFIESLTVLRIPTALDRGSLLLGYTNSLMNPIVYFYFNLSFRKQFRKMIQWIKS